MVPQVETLTAIQINRRPMEVESCFEKSERRRSQIIGKARKNGAPTSACHQLPCLPGTLSVTASHGDVSNAKGRNTTAPANSQTSSAMALTHAEARPSFNEAAV